jgi:DUF4097 and DUF4098 domain-containing protein YvlB
VDVKTGETDSVQVEVHIEADEQKLVDQTRIRFDASREHLDIETDYDEIEENQKLFGLFSFGSTSRPVTNYTLTLPRTASVSVETYSAPVRVGALEGDLKVDAYSGDLTADRTGALEVDTYSGDIRVSRAEGPITVDTYSGDLRADSLSGAVTFTSYSGSATLSFMRLTDDSRFDTYSGDVSLSLSDEMGAVIETTEDAFESDIPVRTEQLDDDRIRATVGDGGPLLRFDSYSGALTLQRR